jgi:hypothetical protein
MESLVNDFKNFSKEFRKSKINLKKFKKKNKLDGVPKYFKQDSNISEDSNDPKRRQNFIKSTDRINLLNVSSLNNTLPSFNQAIHEEAFHSDDDLSNSSGDSKNAEIVKQEESKTELKKMNTKTNSFFVHKKVKNSRMSILADRPLTIFKNQTNVESQFNRLISPQPKIKHKLDNFETLPHKKMRRRKNPQRDPFKKINMTFHQASPATSKFKKRRFVHYQK